MSFSPVKQFEILEHPADLKVRAFGACLEEVFANLALAMAQCMKKVASSNFDVEREIRVEATDRKGLLIDFLSEILYLSDVHNEVYPKVEVSKLSDTHLKAKLFGKKVDGFDLEIKGVSYGQEKLEKKDGTWQAEVLFDI